MNKGFVILCSFLLLLSMMSFVLAEYDEDIQGLEFDSVDIDDECDFLEDFDEELSEDCEQVHVKYEDGEYEVFILFSGEFDSRDMFFSFLDYLPLDSADFLCDGGEGCVLYLSNDDVFYTAWFKDGKYVFVVTPPTNDDDFNEDKWENLFGAYFEMYPSILTEDDAEAFEEGDYDVYVPEEEDDEDDYDELDDCVKWFDGCNTCVVEDGEIGSCTEIACSDYDEPYCIKYESDYDGFDVFKGFTNANWNCYDNIDDDIYKGGEDYCKTSEQWKSYALEYCDGRCYPDGSKCGVNSFSVSNKCGNWNPEKVEELQCRTDRECPQVSCITAPCPQYKCFDGYCHLKDSDYYEDSDDYDTRKYDEKRYDDYDSVEETEFVCNGCADGDSCYPIGYRTDAAYCDVDGFLDQKDQNVGCNNNFECSSNFCVDNECVSQGLIRRIINFFSSLFS